MAPRKYTEAQKQSARKWDAANLDRLSIALPAGSRDKIKAHAQAMGESTNAFIGRAIAETMESDTLPSEVVFANAVDTIAEHYETSKWNVLEELKRLKDPPVGDMQPGPGGG